MAFYVHVLDNFVRTGECEKSDDEPLYDYLLRSMNDAGIRAQVLGDEIKSRVFYDTMIQFVQYNLDRQRFNFHRSQAERNGMSQTLEWSAKKRKDGWQALIKELGEKYKEEGFDASFYQKKFGSDSTYTDDEMWQKMVDDWNTAYRRKQRRQKEKDVEMRRQGNDAKLRNNLRDVPQYLTTHNIDKDDFFQAWGLMGGMWNNVDFERIHKIVAFQRQYPDLLKLARRMGRIADDEGHEKVYAAQGAVYRMEHSSKSDILGVSMGNDLGALMPTELANYSDDDLEDLFMYRYLTKKLQIFRYKSEIMQPSRSLSKQKAQPKGPMIVCLDTSGSMAGRPEKIAASMIVKLLEIADRQRRDLYLIAFSVSIVPMDIRRDRGRLLSFLARAFQGDTDATKMLQATFQLLETDRHYINADVLWISDFKIPLSSVELTGKMQSYRKENTHFYGLQLGVADNAWLPFFDSITRIDYTPERRY